MLLDAEPILPSQLPTSLSAALGVVIMTVVGLLGRIIWWLFGHLDKSQEKIGELTIAVRELTAAAKSLEGRIASLETELRRK